MIELICQQCGRTYRRDANKAAASRFCNRACRVASRRVPPVTKACARCGAVYLIAPNQAPGSRFCGASCKAKSVLEGVSIPRGYMIGNQLRKGRPPSNAFTSARVSGERNPRWVAAVELTCAYCGVGFSRKPHEAGVYCSIACRSAYRRERESGSNSPHWVGGPTTYRGRGWEAARLAAVERDGGACQDCGRVIGASIPVHHRRPFREFATAAEANRLDNLICLCQSCHMRREPRRRGPATAAG